MCLTGAVESTALGYRAPMCTRRGSAATLRRVPGSDRCGDAHANNSSQPDRHEMTAAADILVTCFGLKSQGGNAGMTLLTDSEGFDGMIMTLMKAHPSRFSGSRETFHIRFFIENRSEVDRLGASLKKDGLASGEPRIPVIRTGSPSRHQVDSRSRLEPDQTW